MAIDNWIFQGEIWWADLGEPLGSEAGYRRPVVIIQDDAINQSRIATVICIPLTSNMKWSAAPGTVTLSTKITGLERDSVANPSLIVAINKFALTRQVGKISSAKMKQIFTGLDTILGR